MKTATLRDSAGFLISVAALLLLSLITIALLILNVSVTLSPSPVISRCSETGKVEIHQNLTPPTGTTDASVKFFTQKLINVWLKDPKAEELKRMTSPVFEAITEKSEWKPPKWQQEGVTADFRLLGVKLSGSTAIGSDIYTLGTGTFFFRPLVGDTAAAEKVYAFFRSSGKVLPVTERTPYGLLADMLEVNFFPDEKALNTFLETLGRKTEENRGKN